MSRRFYEPAVRTVLERGEPLTAKQLALRTGAEEQTIRSMLQRMLERGEVLRERSRTEPLRPYIWMLRPEYEQQRQVTP